MTNYVVMPKTDYQNACDSIRAKTGATGILKSGDLSTAINSIQASGGESETALKGLVERTSTSLILPSSITKIGDYSIYNGGTFTSIEMPNTITSIGMYGFYRCLNAQITSLPRSLKTIGQNAFSFCGKMNITAIPSSVTSIENYAFRTCSGLTSLTFEGQPTSISNNAFQECSNLATINVPWAEGEVANAPWGATNATINYNYIGGTA